MAARTIPKVDKALMYVCVESHVSDRGTYREGDRLRGDHVDVQATPIFWVPETFDTDQRHAARQARLYPAKD